METGEFRGFDVALREPGIAVVHFNQPERMNTTTPSMKRDLVETLTQAQMDDAVRVVLFTGSERAFCAGDDLGEGPRGRGGARSLVPKIPTGHTDPVGTYEGLRVLSQPLISAIRRLDKLTIAAIDGYAIQTGLSIALACDFRVATARARLGSATLRFGLLPDEGGQFLVVQLIGVARAMDFFMRRRILTAAEAHELGLVHEVVEPESLMERAGALAEELAEGPQVAQRLLKQSLYHAAEMSFAHALDEIAAKTAISDHHPDAREGVRAFREKRAPRFL